MRLLGVAASGLSEGAAQQLSFDDGDRETHAAAEQVTDQIRDRFGASAIGRAAAVRDGRGVRSPADADQHWGPS